MDFIIRHLNSLCNNQRSELYPQKRMTDRIHCNTVDATQSVRKVLKGKNHLINHLIQGILFLAIVSLAVPSLIAKTNIDPDDHFSKKGITDVVIVNEKNPKIPDEMISGVLFVDSDFFVKSKLKNNDVENILKQEIPVIFYGNQGTRLLKILEPTVCVETPENMMPANRKVTAIGLKATYIGEEYITNGLRVIDSSLEYDHLDAAYDWAKEVESSSLQQETLSEGILQAPYWSYKGTWEDDSFYSPYGKLNTDITIMKLINDGSDTYDWYDMKKVMEVVPGTVCYSSDWRWLWVNHYEHGSAAGGCNAHPVDHDPGYQGWGTSTLQVSVGTTSGDEGGEVTSSWSWSYSRPTLRVYDTSDSSEDIVEQKHKADLGEEGSEYTFLAKPGYCMRVSDGVQMKFWQSNTAKYYKPVLWWYEYYTAPADNLGYVTAGP